MNEKCNDNEKCEITHNEKKCEIIEIMPLVDIIEDEHAMVMYFEIPGSAPEDVNIEVANHILSVQAESSLTRRGCKILFKRSFQLTSATDIAKIHAKTKDGVLTLTLPTSESAKVHKIKVSA